MGCLHVSVHALSFVFYVFVRPGRDKLCNICGPRCPLRMVLTHVTSSFFPIVYVPELRWAGWKTGRFSGRSAKTWVLFLLINLLMWNVHVHKIENSICSVDYNLNSERRNRIFQILNCTYFKYMHPYFKRQCINFTLIQ